jgi:predicted homoserine dehydrogenase-like protein
LFRIVITDILVMDSMRRKVKSQLISALFAATGHAKLTATHFLSALQHLKECVLTNMHSVQKEHVCK